MTLSDALKYLSPEFSIYRKTHGISIHFSKGLASLTPSDTGAKDWTLIPNGKIKDLNILEALQYARNGFTVSLLIDGINKWTMNQNDVGGDYCRFPIKVISSDKWFVDIVLE